jgi:hypothetical protein
MKAHAPEAAAAAAVASAIGARDDDVGVNVLSAIFCFIHIPEKPKSM